MYKNLLRFTIALLVFFILSGIYILIYLTLKNNTIIVDSGNYPKILDEVHSNIDKYIGKKISINGYVYIQEDFDKNYFVIAQNVFIDSVTEPVIIGFLCKNCSNIQIEPYETISITGRISKCKYNGFLYPIILVNSIR